MASIGRFLIASLMIIPFGTLLSLPCDGYHGYGNKRIESADTCYVYFSQFLPKDTVEANCYDRGLQLVMFETTQEQNWLKNQLAASGLYTTIWTAGEKLNNVWKWYDGRREVTITTIDTSRISSPNSDQHLMLDPGPNILTPRNKDTYHYFICETQAQAIIQPTTIMTTIETTSDLTTEGITTSQPTTESPEEHYHCLVVENFERIYQSVPFMRMIQNETIQSRYECMMKCTKHTNCDLVQIDKCNGSCILFNRDGSFLSDERECTSSVVDCYLRH